MLPSLLRHITFIRGTAQHPTDYVYDSLNHMPQPKIYRVDASTAALTTWACYMATGLLNSKTFADGNSVSYSYTGDGKLSKLA